MKKIIIVGGTSGIGRETALLYINANWQVGIAGRRAELLEELRLLAPDRVCTRVIDICTPQAGEELKELIRENGGMDVYFHSSGIGFQNPELDIQTELNTTGTNVEGFTRMVTTAFNYFKEQKQGGHIAVISSIAGTKGLGAAPSYSATKRYQNTYIQALSQLSHMKHLGITFTDIRPGFVDTALIKNSNFPLLMKPEKVARTIYHAVNNHKRIVTIDWKYRMLVAVWRLIPRFIWERMPVSKS